MSSVSRSTVYSLIAIVCVLLVGITALLRVASHRHQRLEDMTIDLQRTLSQQEGQIRTLQQRLENCDTVKAAVPNNAIPNRTTTLDSARVITQIIPKR